MSLLDAPDISYQKNHLINVTTQPAPEGRGWRVIVDFPPHLRSRDKTKMVVWLKEYEQTIRRQLPNTQVTIYCDEPRCVLEAIPQANDEGDTAGLAKTRLRHMSSILGRYGQHLRTLW